MASALRRLFWLALLGGAGYAGWRWYAQRPSAPATAGPTAAPPPPARPSAASADTAAPSTGPAEATAADDTATTTTGRAATDAPVATGTATGWVAPEPDGTCPVTHPVKANDNSGIFHVPGGRFYERTRPERCYASPESAAADGYRAAKS